MKDHYTYDEALEIIEKFMIDSGIREYCSRICKGKCCLECYTSEDACYKNEGRRLPCSTFICDSLLSHLNSSVRKRWYNAAVFIEREIGHLLGSKDEACYFNVNTPEVQNAFKIPKPLLDNLVSKIDGVKSVEKTMRCLIDNNIRVR